MQNKVIGAIVKIVGDIVMIIGGLYIFTQNYQYWSKYGGRAFVYWFIAG